MYWSNKLELVVMETEQDPAGYPREVERRAVTVYGDVMSANRAEFYAALSAGIQADCMFIIPLPSWEKGAYRASKARLHPNVVRYDGHEFNIVRTYTTDRYEIQLTCTRRE